MTDAPLREAGKAVDDDPLRHGPAKRRRRWGDMTIGAFVAGDDLDVEQRDGGAQIRLLGLLMLIVTPLAFAYHAVMHSLFPGTFALPSFLFYPGWRFNDYFEPYLVARLYAPGPAGSTDTVYSPLMHLFMTALTHAPDVAGLMLILAVFGASLVALLWYGVTARVGPRRLRQGYVVIFCFLSYPVLMVVDRANLEMLVFALLVAFVWLHYWRGSRWAFLPLALAIAAKYYAVVLIVVFVAERRWRALALCLAAAFAVEAAATVALSAISRFTIPEVIANTVHTLRSGNDTGTVNGVWFSHNLVGAYALVDRLTGYGLQSTYGSRLALDILQVGIFAVVVLRVCLYDMPAWKRLAALVVCMTVLAPESRDYTLIHLLLPLALVGRDGWHCPHRWLIAALFSVMLVPMAWIPYQTPLLPAHSLLNFSMIIYPAALLALLAVMLSTGVTAKAAGSPASGVGPADDPVLATPFEALAPPRREARP